MDYSLYVGSDLDFKTSDYVWFFNGAKTGFLTTPASLQVNLNQTGKTSNDTLLSQGTVDLTNLTQGSHQLTVWIDVMDSKENDAVLDYLGSVYSSVWFNVDTIPPSISIRSPNPTSYSTSNVLLDFTVNKTVSQLTYSLDNGSITSATNRTLTGLSNGMHNLTIYAVDTAGNVGNQTVTFNVQQSAINPSNFIFLIAVPNSHSMLNCRSTSFQKASKNQ